MRPALEAFHPLALSGALASSAAHDEFAGRVVRDAAHPLPPDGGFADPRGEAAVWWAVKGAGRYLARPEPDDPTAVGYSPRCGGQYVRAAGPCSGCGTEVQLLAGPAGVRK